MAGKPYKITFNSTDPEGHDVHYYINWGDNNSEWTDYYQSEKDVTFSHTYNQSGLLTITIKSEDIFGKSSGQTNVKVYIITNRAIAVTNPVLFRLLESLMYRFPLLEQFLLNIR